MKHTTQALRKTSKQQLVEDMQESTLIRHDQEKCYVTKEFDAVADIKRIVDLVSAILRSKQNLFSVGRVGNGKQKHIVATPLGHRVLLAIRTIHEVSECFSEHHFHPYVEMFIEGVKCMELCIHYSNGKLCSEDHRVELCATLNHFITDIREEAGDPVFKARFKNIKRVIRNNSKGLKAYLDELFKCYARLLVIRLDVGYRKYPTSLGGSKNITCEQAKEDWQRLWKYLRAEFPALVGFAWKLESRNPITTISCCVWMAPRCNRMSSLLNRSVNIGKMSSLKAKGLITTVIGTRRNTNT